MRSDRNTHSGAITAHQATACPGEAAGLQSLSGSRLQNRNGSGNSNLFIDEKTVR